MRLISDEDLKDRASEYCLSEDEYRRFCKIIDAEPTACDMDNLRKIANCKELEEVTGIPLKELAEIFRQHIPNACQHPEKACVLTDGDVDKWRKYQQLDKHGRLIKLPCKVGDTVYQIFENFIEPCTVEVIFWGDYTDKDGNHCNMAEIHYDREDCPCVLGDIYFTDFGKTVFLTKSAAEAKLKELR